MNEAIVIDHDPPPKGHRDVPVTLTLDVPPRAVSHGWGDMSWAKPT